MTPNGGTVASETKDVGEGIRVASVIDPAATSGNGGLAWRMLAWSLAAIHIAYVVFVLFGGLLVLAWPRLMAVHLASVIWAGATMIGNLGCPITSWEKSALQRAGLEPYPEGFLQHHVLRTRFDPANARRNHIVLGIIATGLNVAIYAYAP